MSKTRNLFSKILIILTFALLSQVILSQEPIRLKLNEQKVVLYNPIKDKETSTYQQNFVFTIDAEQKKKAVLLITENHLFTLTLKSAEASLDKKTTNAISLANVQNTEVQFVLTLTPKDTAALSDSKVTYSVLVSTDGQVTLQPNVIFSSSYVPTSSNVVVKLPSDFNKDKDSAELQVRTVVYSNPQANASAFPAILSVSCDGNEPTFIDGEGNLRLQFTNSLPATCTLFKNKDVTPEKVFYRIVLQIFRNNKLFAYNLDSQSNSKSFRIYNILPGTIKAYKTYQETSYASETVVRAVLNTTTAAAKVTLAGKALPEGFKAEDFPAASTEGTNYAKFQVSDKEGAVAKIQAVTVNIVKLDDKSRLEYVDLFFQDAVRVLPAKDSGLINLTLSKNSYAVLKLENVEQIIGLQNYLYAYAHHIDKFSGVHAEIGYAKELNLDNPKSINSFSDDKSIEGISKAYFDANFNLGEKNDFYLYIYLVGDPISEYYYQDVSFTFEFFFSLNEYIFIELDSATNPNVRLNFNLVNGSSAYIYAKVKAAENSDVVNYNTNAFSKGAVSIKIYENAAEIKNTTLQTYMKEAYAKAQRFGAAFNKIQNNSNVLFIFSGDAQYTTSVEFFLEPAQSAKDVTFNASNYNEIVVLKKGETLTRSVAKDVPSNLSYDAYITKISGKDLKVTANFNSVDKELYLDEEEYLIHEESDTNKNIVLNAANEGEENAYVLIRTTNQKASKLVTGKQPDTKACFYVPVQHDNSEDEITNQLITLATQDKNSIKYFIIKQIGVVPTSGYVLPTFSNSENENVTFSGSYSKKIVIGIDNSVVPLTVVHNHLVCYGTNAESTVSVNLETQTYHSVSDEYKKIKLINGKATVFIRDLFNDDEEVSDILDTLYLSFTPANGTGNLYVYSPLVKLSKTQVYPVTEKVDNIVKVKSSPEYSIDEKFYVIIEATDSKDNEAEVYVSAIFSKESDYISYDKTKYVESKPTITVNDKEKSIELIFNNPFSDEKGARVGTFDFYLYTIPKFLESEYNAELVTKDSFSYINFAQKYNLHPSVYIGKDTKVLLSNVTQNAVDSILFAKDVATGRLFQYTPSGKYLICNNIEVSQLFFVEIREEYLENDKLQYPICFTKKSENGLLLNIFQENFTKAQKYIDLSLSKVYVNDAVVPSVKFGSLEDNNLIRISQQSSPSTSTEEKVLFNLVISNFNKEIGLDFVNGVFFETNSNRKDTPYTVKVHEVHHKLQFFLNKEATSVNKLKLDLEFAQPELYLLSYINTTSDNLVGHILADDKELRSIKYNVIDHEIAFTHKLEKSVKYSIQFDFSGQTPDNSHFTLENYLVNYPILRVQDHHTFDVAGVDGQPVYAFVSIDKTKALGAIKFSSNVDLEKTKAAFTSKNPDQLTLTDFVFEQMHGDPFYKTKSFIYFSAPSDIDVTSVILDVVLKKEEADKGNTVLEILYEDNQEFVPNKGVESQAISNEEPLVLYMREKLLEDYIAKNDDIYVYIPKQDDLSEEEAKNVKLYISYDFPGLEENELMNNELISSSGSNYLARISYDYDRLMKSEKIFLIIFNNNKKEINLSYEIFSNPSPGSSYDYFNFTNAAVSSLPYALKKNGTKLVRGYIEEFTPSKTYITAVKPNYGLYNEDYKNVSLKVAVERSFASFTQTLIVDKVEESLIYKETTLQGGDYVTILITCKEEFCFGDLHFNSLTQLNDKNPTFKYEENTIVSFPVYDTSRPVDYKITFEKQANLKFEFFTLQGMGSVNYNTNTNATVKTEPLVSGKVKIVDYPKDTITEFILRNHSAKIYVLVNKLEQVAAGVDLDIKDNKHEYNYDSETVNVPEYLAFSLNGSTKTNVINNLTLSASKGIFDDTDYLIIPTYEKATETQPVYINKSILDSSFTTKNKGGHLKIQYTLPAKLNLTVVIRPQFKKNPTKTDLPESHSFFVFKNELTVTTVSKELTDLSFFGTTENTFVTPVFSDRNAVVNLYKASNGFNCILINKTDNYSSFSLQSWAGSASKINDGAVSNTYIVKCPLQSDPSERAHVFVQVNELNKESSITEKDLNQGFVSNKAKVPYKREAMNDNKVKFNLFLKDTGLLYMENVKDAKVSYYLVYDDIDMTTFVQLLAKKDPSLVKFNDDLTLTTKEFEANSSQKYRAHVFAYEETSNRAIYVSEAELDTSKDSPDPTPDPKPVPPKPDDKGKGLGWFVIFLIILACIVVILGILFGIKKYMDRRRSYSENEDRLMVVDNRNSNINDA